MRTSLFNFSSQTASNDDVEAQSTDISVIGGSKSAVNSKFGSRFSRASVVILERISFKCRKMKEPITVNENNARNQ